MPDSTTQIVGGLKALAVPAFNAARKQWKIRGANLANFKGVNVEREFDEALGVLIGDSETALESLTNWTKAQLSDRSNLFEDEPVREWLRSRDVQRTIKDAALAFIEDKPIDAHRAEAEQSYNRSSGDFDWYGGALFDLAVAYLAFALDAKLTTGERLISQQVIASASSTLEAIASVESTQDRNTAALLAAIRDAHEFPTSAVREYIDRFIRRENQIRAIVDPERVDRVLGVASKMRDGELRQAPDDLKARVFQLAMQTLAREGRTEEAAEWLGRARDVGGSRLDADEARLAIYGKDYQRALDVLRGRGDREALSLKIDVLERRDGRVAALKFFQEHHEPNEVSGYLLSSIARWYVLENEWQKAEITLLSADDTHINENPVLLLLRARLRLALMLPETQRADMYDNGSAFPQPIHLRDDREGKRLIAAAIDDVESLLPRLSELQVPEFANLVETNKLYLELASRDSRFVERAKERLKELLASATERLKYAWLAATFDIGFDLATLKAELEKGRLLAGWSDLELFAATQLVLRSGDSDQILAFAREHRSALVNLLPPDMAYGLEIEILARNGDVGEAQKLLDEARDRLSTQAVIRLETVIAEESGTDGLALRLRAYEKTGSDTDLYFLVRALIDRSDPRTGQFAAKLWEAQHKIEDAVRACDSMFNAGQDREIERFLAELGDVVEENPRLQEHSAWVAYRLGDLGRAQEIVEQLRGDQPDSDTLRQLQVNIAIEAGDWHRLGPLVRQDLDRVDQRSPQQLLQAAGLAHAADNPIADELIRAAVNKAPNDAQVLTAAFTLATRRGRDWDAEASDWLRRAIELSSEDGPLQQKALSDVIKLRDESQERSRQLDSMIMSGQIPLGMAVRPLGTSYSELILGRMPANVQLRDARRRLCLPLIAGNRLRVDLSALQRVGFDPPALLVLHLAGVLNEALQAFPTILLPSGTFPLLFRELERAESIQPSRTAQAARIKSVITSGRISEFELTGAQDDFLECHAKAEALDAYFVHSAPIYEPGSFLERIRDPAPFASRLVSAVSLVRALSRAGEIAADELAFAEKRLQSLGEPWPDEPDISLEKPMVIDGTVLNALDDARVLEPLLSAGVDVHVDMRVRMIVDAELQQQEAARQLTRSIRQVQEVLAGALERGQAKIGPLRRNAGDDALSDASEAGMETELAPLLSLLRDGTSIDALISADRVVNRHPQLVDQEKNSRPVYTPLDVLDHLFASGAIGKDRYAGSLRKLREAGLAFIPIEVDEIAAAALEGDWSKQVPRPLRAICQSIQLPIVRGALVFPETRHWISQVALNFAQAVRRVWKEAPTADVAKKAADYLFLNVPYLIGLGGDDDGGEWAVAVTAACHGILAMPLEIGVDRLDAYHSWHAEMVQPRLDGRDRRSAGLLADRLRELVLLQGDVKNEETGETIVTAEEASFFVVGRMPPELRDPVVRDDLIRARLSDNPDAIAVGSHPVSNAVFAKFLADTYAGREALLTDLEGADLSPVVEMNTDGSLSLTVGDERLRVSEAGLYAADKKTRSKTITRILEANTMAPSAAAKWRAAAKQAPFSADLFLALVETLRATPEAWIADAIEPKKGGLPMGQLTETDPTYFRNLLDLQNPSDPLHTIVEALTREIIREGRVRDRLSVYAPFTVFPGFNIVDLAAALSDDQAAYLAVELVGTGDPFSATAAFQLLCARPMNDVFKEAGIQILERLLGPEGLLERSSHDFAACALTELIALDRRNTLADLPFGVRRFAAFIHAAYATRALTNFEVKRPDFFNEARGHNGFNMQLGGLVERSESVGWLRDWLIPDAIFGLCLRRLYLAFEGVDTERRPEEWEKRLSDELERVKGGGIIGMFLPEPLDEFVADYAPPTQDVTEQLSAIERAADEELPKLIYVLCVTQALPNELPDAVVALKSAFDRASRKIRSELVDMLLAIAARWRAPELSDYVLDREMLEPDLKLSSSAHLLLSVANAVADGDAAAQRARLARAVENVSFGNSPPDELREFATGLEILANMAPKWSADLEKARAAALLGS